MAEFQIGSAYIEVHARDNSDREARSIERRLSRIRATATVDVDIDKRSLASARRNLSLLGKDITGLGDRNSGLLKLIGNVGLLSAASAHALPIVAGAAASVVQLSGAALLAPAAIGAGAIAMAGFKLATAGFTDALTGSEKKQREAYAAMGAGARQLVDTIKGLGPQASKFRQWFQDASVKGLSSDVKALAGTYFPLLRRNMGQTADTMNQMARGSAKALMRPAAVNDVNEVFRGTNGLLFRMRNSVADVTSGFLGLAGVGATRLPALGSAVGGVTAKFKAWVDRAVESGRINEIIDLAIAGLHTLGDIGGNIGSVVVGVFRAANTEGGGFLGTVKVITGQIAAMVNSVQGQEALRTFFQTGSILAGMLRLALAAILPILPDVVRLFQALAVNIGGTLLSAVKFLAPWLGTVARFLTDHVNIIGPLILVVAGLSGAVRVLTTVQSAVTAGLRLWAIAQAAVNLVLSLNPIGIVIIAVTALVAAIVIAYQKSQTFRDVVNAVWASVKAAFQTAIDGIRGGLAWLWGAWETTRARTGQVWDWIGQKINAVKDFIVRTVFDPFNRAIAGIATMFRNTADAIGRAWDSIREKARAPVQWVIDVVYNNGVRRLWNGVASVFGGNQLPELHLARGGIVPGRDYGYDTVPAMLRGGEGVLVPEAVRALGGAGGIHQLNRMAESQHFAAGGVAGFTGSGSATASRNFATGSVQASSSIGSFMSDLFSNPVAAVRKLFASVVGDGNRTPGSGSFPDALRRLPGLVIDKIIAKAKGLFAGGGVAGVGPVGAGVQRWSGLVLQALAMMGQPASLLGSVLRRMNQESGGNPRAINLWDSNAKRGTPSIGLMQTIGPTFRAYHDPRTSWDIYDPLANVLASMRYALARYGSLSAAYNRAGGYDLGGVASGAGFLAKATVAPERVLSPRQTQAFERLVDHLTAGGGTQGDRPVTVNVQQTSGSPAETGRFVALALRTA